MAKFVWQTVRDFAMELAQLRYFLKIVEHRNFTRAAKACKVSQPALSQQMAKLEKELNLPLFERQGRQIRLTHTGRNLRSHAEKILQMVEDTERQIKDNGRTGKVNLSTVSSVGPYLTTRLILNLNKQFPEAEIQFHEESPESLFNRCASGEIDFAITAIQPQWSKRLVCEPIVDEEIFAVVSVNHPLASKSSLTPNDLLNQPMVLMSQSQCLTQTIEEFLSKFGIYNETVARVEQIHTLQHMVAIGMGMSFVPKMAISSRLKNNLRYIPIAGATLWRTVGVCWSKDRFQSQLVTNMIKAIREFADPNLLSESNENASLPKKSKRRSSKADR